MDQSLLTSEALPNVYIGITLATFQLLIKDPVQIDKFIINARKSQMTETPAFKEWDVIPSIPVVLFTLSASSSFKTYEDSTFGILQLILVGTLHSKPNALPPTKASARLSLMLTKNHCRQLE